MTTTETPGLVRRFIDTSPEPLVGCIVGRQDEDQVLVAWGDARFSADPLASATVETEADLTPWTRKLQDLTNLVAGLRSLANFYEAHPELDLPLGHTILNAVSHLPNPKAEMAAHIRAALASGVEVVKRYDDTWGFADLVFGGGLVLQVYAHRDAVCERIVTGTRQVTKEVPDPAALAAVPTVTVTETVEDVEWVCSPLLATEPVTA